MDQETIQKIAAEVVKHLPSYPWALLAIQTVLMAVAAALGAFFSEYFKTRGKHLATKADFDEVLSQLRANTELVETIKTEVAQKDWARREWTNLRRIKLEELLNQSNECVTYVARSRNTALEGNPADQTDHDPVNRLDSLGTLYFPELAQQTGAYSRIYTDLMVTIAKLAQDAHAAIRDGRGYDAAVAGFSLSWKDQYPRLLAARHELRTAARALIVKIVGVED